MEQKKYHVLIVHNKYQIQGGEDTVVKNDVSMLRKHGHDVFLYERDNTELNSFSLLKKLFLPFSFIYSFKTVKDIKRIIRDNQIDLVHVHNTLLLVSPSVYYVCKQQKIPVVQTIHNFRFICPNALLYRDGHICEDCINRGLYCAITHNCYRGNKLQTLACVVSMWIHRKTGINAYLNFICLTDFNKDKLLSLRSIDENKVYIKPNYSLKTTYKDTSILNQFLYVGRLDKTKGINFLIESWKVMGKGAPKLLVFGDGPELEWCNQQITNYNLPIIMMGQMPHNIIIEEMKKSKALLLPTQWFEGFPMVIVEAYSVGLPVLASNIGNTGNLVLDGKTGWKFSPHDMNDFIRILKKNLPNRRTIWEYFNELYTEDVNYLIMMEIYNKVVSKWKI